MITTARGKTFWKRVFQEFMIFFFPVAAGQIDWEKGYEFLDKELQQVLRDADLGRRYADKLVKVWLDNGQETFVLVHEDGTKVKLKAERKARFKPSNWV